MNFHKVIREEATVGAHLLVSVAYSDVVMLSDEVATFWKALPEFFTSDKGIAIGKSTIHIFFANDIKEILKHFIDVGLIEIQ